MTTLDEGVTVGRLPLGVIAISVSLAAAIFAFDLSLPLGVAGGVPYVALVLVGLWSPWRPYLLLLAITAIALTILGFVLSPPGGEPWVVATNRALALFAICAAAVLVFQRRRSDEAQRESEVRYRELVESSPDAILVHASGKIVFANAFAAKLLGRQRPEDLIGVPALEIVPPDDREEIRERQRRTGESDGKVAFGEERLLALDGSTVAVEVTAVPVRYGGNAAIQLVARDISERKVAEQAVRESESQLRLLTDSLPMLISYIDAGQHYRFVNKAYEEWYGQSIEDVRDRHVREIMGESIYETGRDYFARALSGEECSLESWITYPETGKRYIHASYVPDIGVNGEVKGFFQAVTDITALKQSEQELQDAHDNLEVQVKERTAELTEANALLREEAVQRKQIEESLRLTQFTLDHAGDTVFWFGESGKFEYVNQAGRRMLGYSWDELSEMQLWDVDPAVVQADWPSTWARSIGRGNHTFEAVHRTKDGAEIPVEVTTTPVFGERQIVCSFSRDIAERKRAEEALRSTTETLEAIFEASPVAINTIDLEGRLLNWNPASETIFGWRKEEVLGKPLPYMPELEKESLLERQEALFQGQSVSGLEVRRLRKDGTLIDVSFSGAPLRDSSGRIVGAVGILADITERKRVITERKRADEELLAAKEQAELANRAKSEFLANMSHELRTPLNAIIGFSEIISDEMFGPVGNRKYKGYGADIHSSGVHLLSIINDLLDLSKIDAGKIEIEDRELDVERVTEAAMQMVSESVEAAGLKAELQVADRLPGLRADERAVTQILLNLLSNATKFTPKGGRITVQVGVDGEQRFVIAVSDTGIGIAEDDLPWALTPFGQLENSQIRKHDGTGLGLPLVQKLVELHGGAFELESEAGAGTTAIARFPSQRTVYR